MRDNIDIIGVFHDGSVVEINGSLPNISLRVEIPYLRNMFETQGDSIIAYIEGCTSISFLNWEEESTTYDLKEIENEKPEILSVEQKGEVAHILCSTGELDILYRDISFELDDGKNISAQEIGDACELYWNDWESRR